MCSILVALSDPFFKLRWLPSSYRKQTEQVFLCEVAHLAETATKPNTREASDSSAGFCGFYDNNNNNNNEHICKAQNKNPQMR